MRAGLLFLLCLTLYGCQTQGQKKLESIQQGAQTATQQITNCINRVESNPSYASIANRYPINWNNAPTVLQYADTSVPSEEDIQKIVSVFNEMALCRELGIKLFMDIMPGIVPIAVEGFTDEDILTADLILKKLTWGEYNRERSQVRNKGLSRMRVVTDKVFRELVQSHNAEQHQRKKALNALSEWADRQQIILQNQEMLNSLNRPVITHCTGNRYRYSLTCTTF